MAKKTAETTVENIENAQNESTFGLRFVESELFKGSVECVIATPENWDGTFTKVSLFDSRSALNAIAEVLGKCVVIPEPGIHMHNEEYSRERGSKMFYVGGGVIRDAVIAGEKAINLTVNGQAVRVTLPAFDEEKELLIGEWAQVYLNTPFSGRAAPANDLGHMKNLDLKHFYIDTFSSGRKLLIFTRPSLVKGELWSKASLMALRMKETMLNEDGSLKTPAEISATYFEYKRENSGDRDISKLTELTKVAVEMGVAEERTSIIVDGVAVSCWEVPAGFYQAYKGPVLKEIRITIFNNSDSGNKLVTMATNGLSLKTVKKF